MNKLATILLCANFITVLFPQPGYIHPDEFFQSSEIVAGDILNVQHFRVWEFNGTSAVRTIVFPYLVMSPSLYLLRWMNSTGISELQLSAVKVVMATRLPISFLSLLGYIATGRLADSFHINRYVSTVLYCSSYITWTYYTRTFSNSVESVLLAIVLLLVLIFSGGGDSANQVKSGATLDENLKSKCAEEVLDENPTDNSFQENNESETQKRSSLPVAIKTKKDAAESLHSKQKKVLTDKETSEEINNTDKKSAKKGKKSAKKGNDKIVKESEEKTEKDEFIGDKVTGVKKGKSANEEADWRNNIDELSRLRACIAKLVSFLLGAIVTAGFFNRPTFLGFAATPVLYWLWSATRPDHQGRWCGASLVSIIFFMTIGALLTFVTFVLLDTIYFNPAFLSVASNVIESFRNEQFSLTTVQSSLQAIASALVVTPWNFIKYNSNSDNLSQHGLHPRFTHFLINLPLLLGPLFIPFIIVCSVSIFRLLIKPVKNKHKNLAWLSFMALVPIIGLSVFPHQEPRFLIPALPVFVVMGAKIVSAMMPGRLSFFALWTVFNILLTLVYGYMHQAALIPALSIYQQKLSSSLSSKNYHAIFYKTYSPPRHLLLLHPDNSQFHIHELAGAPIDTFLQTLKQVQDGCEKSKTKCRIFVFVPSTVTPRVLDRLKSNKISTTSICPHLSMEAPPRVWAWWKKRLSFDEMIMDFCLNVLSLT